MNCTLCSRLLRWEFLHWFTRLKCMRRVLFLRAYFSAAKYTPPSHSYRKSIYSCSHVTFVVREDNILQEEVFQSQAFKIQTQPLKQVCLQLSHLNCMSSLRLLPQHRKAISLLQFIGTQYCTIIVNSYPSHCYCNPMCGGSSKFFSVMASTSFQVSLHIGK